MPDNELRFTTRVDLSGLDEGVAEVKGRLEGTAESTSASFAQAGETVEEFNARVHAAEEAFAQLEAVGGETLSVLQSELAKLNGEKITYVEALEKAVAETQKWMEANQSTVTTLDALSAAQQKAAFSVERLAELRAQQELQSQRIIQADEAEARSKELLTLKTNILARAQEQANALRAEQGLAAMKAEQARTSLIAEEAANKEGRAKELLALKNDILARSVQELTAVEEAHAAASGHTGAAISAASGAIRELEGKLPIRAVERFLATTLQLGPVLEMAFPVVGAIAAAEVLWDLGEKAHKVYEEFFGVKWMAEDLSKTLEANGEKIASAWEKTSALTHATGMRDNPVGTLRADIEQAKEGLASLEQRAKDTQHSINVLKFDQFKAKNWGYGGISDKEFNTSLMARESYRDTLNAQIDEQKARIADLESQEAKAEQKKSGSSRGGRDGNSELYRAMQEEFNERKLYYTMTLGEERDFWAERLEIFDKSTSQYLAIQNRLIQIDEQSARQAHQIVERAKRAMDEQSKLATHAPAVATDGGLLGTAQQWDQYAQASARYAQAQDRANATVREAQLAGMLAFGSMSPLDALYEEQSLHARAYADQLRDLEVELKRIGADQNLSEAQKRTQSTNVRAQMATVEGQRDATAYRDSSNIEKEITKPFRSAFQSVNSEWLSLQGKLIFGTKDIGVAFANMGVSILTSGAAWMEKYLAKKAETYLAEKVLHLTTESAKATTTATTEATQTATVAAANAARLTSTVTANVAAAQSYAAVAAAAAAASVAAIPVVGPGLAAAAAASTYASTSAYTALAAFETGGIIPNTGVALVHQGEAVLPKALTNFLMGAAGSSSTTNNNGRFSQHNNFSGLTDSQFRRQAQRNGDVLISSARKSMRSMGKF